MIRTMFGRKKPWKMAEDTKIVWQDPQAAAAPNPRPVKYHAPVAPDPELMPAFIVGRPVMTKHAFVISPQRGIYPFPVLERARRSNAGSHIAVPVGSLLVYTGAIRTSESKRLKGKIHEMRVIKHTFLVPCGRCIVHDQDFRSFTAI
jgi:hypothetical protein